MFDFASAAQVFYEAREHGCDIEIHFCSYEKNIRSASGLPIGKIKQFTEMKLKKGDYLFISSAEINYTLSKQFKPKTEVLNWLIDLHNNGISICALCIGTFLLGYTGLLNGRNCTTHWKRTPELQDCFPLANVKENMLFVQDGTIITSAGASSGVDVALYILQKLKNNYFAYTISRELVIYNRRNGDDVQQNVYVNYRNHVHAGIHKVQDWLQQNLKKGAQLNELAEIACMSERNFTRTFKRETGHTVNDYITGLRKQKIKELMQKPEITRSEMAKACGLKSERHVARLMES